MNGLIRHLMLTAQARTGFSPQALICTAVAALWAAIAVGFGLLAAFILLAQRFGSLTAGLALAGLFLVIAVIAGVNRAADPAAHHCACPARASGARQCPLARSAAAGVGVQVGQAVG